MRRHELILVLHFAMQIRRARVPLRINVTVANVNHDLASRGRMYIRARAEKKGARANSNGKHQRDEYIDVLECDINALAERRKKKRNKPCCET